MIYRREGNLSTCSMCQEEFRPTNTEEEALAKKKERGWGDVPIEECVIVCNDCYKLYIEPMWN